MMTLKKFYRSKCGRHDFHFAFTQEADEVGVYCLSYPVPHGRDLSPHKTHIFANRRICFVAGKAPKTQARAEELARQWAEYILEYARTGAAQS